MARRRSANLLSSEEAKPSNSTAAETEQSADELEAEILDVAGEKPTIASNPIPNQASPVVESHSTQQDEAVDPQTIPAPKDEALLQQIADLTAALEAQKATTKQLQTALEEAQKATIEQLQTALEPMNALKTELEQSRKDVRKLTDSNDKLMQELENLQPQETAIDTRTPTMKAASRSYKELRLSSPPIAATGNPPNAFNKDVGWFD